MSLLVVSVNFAPMFDSQNNHLSAFIVNGIQNAVVTDADTIQGKPLKLDYASWTRILGERVNDRVDTTENAGRE